ncbi:MULTISPECIES: large conductance mechanosensitive channel protein MscL [Oceanobacillus]|uniref:Large-conductance mechanosensitive channel n=1 Tax=Oceanobacillus kimchii TaxID=746691 RepID=A0ABQ5TK08_9BACI|nr:MULTISPECIES: large conductance mechanosensitive channel protein MscL [Oceanobacillus]MBT2599270.1 large conductance mechanosensitive channel protein MscL [Oceanobacillus sp. ISL-74]MBT2652188.1 large conductance mechanosensitive channel protein MscL [Oceanobacillus sp. ISL-73]MCT1578530.1 large conductance mechanosensitive channel protein MscL [Oceanobacillus kimchii]MCT2136421.1 large conductance mechanosensitive channel protein MscL [Oceanobacillus kimchii]OEH54173.1 large-conductance me
MWKEFKEFAFKGNIIDLAVAVVIGGAFGAIVTSFVENIITPLMGIVVGGIDFTSLKVTVGEAELLYGNFIQSFVDFIIIALSIFLAIKFLTKFKRQKEEEVEEVVEELSKQEVLLEEIRDLLKEQSNNK